MRILPYRIRDSGIPNPDSRPPNPTFSVNSAGQSAPPGASLVQIVPLQAKNARKSLISQYYLRMHSPIKYLEKGLSVAANGAWTVFNAANRINPGASFIPKWSEKPLLKSWQK